MKQSEVCIPVEDRVPNWVDTLNLQIKQIRKSCKHDFRLIKRPELQESLVPGVMVGKTEGPVKVGGRSEMTMTLVCLHCSEEKETTIMETCPRCLGKMKMAPHNLGAGSREKYFGCDHLYFSIRYSCCQNCGLTIASDEWDQ